MTIIKITAICFDPDEADFWDGKGVALQKLGKDKEAKDCFDKAEQLK
ncbi:MAG: tetratricopeptide repeat protein [Candidatus Nitrosopolaris sp.]